MFDLLQKEREFIEEPIVEAFLQVPGNSQHQREVDLLMRKFLGELAATE